MALLMEPSLITTAAGGGRGFVNSLLDGLLFSCNARSKKTPVGHAQLETNLARPPACLARLALSHGTDCGTELLGHDLKKFDLEY